MNFNLLAIVLIALLFSSCSIKQQEEISKNRTLFIEIKNLSKNINPNEAEALANIATTYSKSLAKKYKIVTPAILHNSLINLNLKTKGFCYDFTTDLLKELNKKNFKTINLLWAVHKKGEYWEHNAIVVIQKNQDFKEGIILDAWRDSGNLYWGKVKDDTSYNWLENKAKSEFYGHINDL